MKDWIETLNLTPSERRLVFLVALVVFVVLNIWFVFPLFGQWDDVEKKLEQASSKLVRYESKVSEIPALRTTLTELEGATASVGDFSEQAVDLAKRVENQADASRLAINRRTPGRSDQNEFFQEQTYSINYVAKDEALYEFLAYMSDPEDPTTIRIRSMTIKPDRNQTQLEGNIVFVASYKKESDATPDNGNSDSNKIRSSEELRQDQLTSRNNTLRRRTATENSQ